MPNGMLCTFMTKKAVSAEPGPVVVAAEGRDPTLPGTPKAWFRNKNYNIPQKTSISLIIHHKCSNIQYLRWEMNNFDSISLKKSWEIKNLGFSNRILVSVSKRVISLIVRVKELNKNQSNSPPLPLWLSRPKAAIPRCLEPQKLAFETKFTTFLTNATVLFIFDQKC